MARLNMQVHVTYVHMDRVRAGSPGTTNGLGRGCAGGLVGAGMG